MKNFLISIVIVIGFLIVSCNKDEPSQSLVATSNNTDTSILVGNWNIISDFSSAMGNDPLPVNKQSNYIGLSGDYYNITQTGNIYEREGANYDTMAYSFVSSNQIKLIAFYMDGSNITSIQVLNGDTIKSGGIMGIYNIKELKLHSLILTFLSQDNPSGLVLYDSISLKR